MHLSSVLHRHTNARCVASPQIELFVDERVGAVAFDEDFCLLEVGESFEGEVRRSGAIDRVPRGVRISGEI